MEKQFLNENKYQKAKKGLIVVAVTIMVTAVTISGVFLLYPGFSKLSEANNRTDLDVKYEALAAPIQSQITTLSRQNSQVFMSEGFSANYYTLKDQETALQSQLSKINKQKSDEFMSQGEAAPYIAGGVMLILLGFGVGAQLLLLAFGRNIFAFGAQSTVPVAKEVIEDVAPTIGKAYGDAAKAAAPGLGEAIGTFIKGASPAIGDASKNMGPAFGSIAKEVSKGIKEGLSDDKKRKE
jgi:hypothetical protein